MGKGPSLQEAVAWVAAVGHEIIVFRAVTTTEQCYKLHSQARVSGPR